MKAVLMHSNGGINVLKLAEIAPPKITQPHEVLVRLKAAGVNPIDTKIRSRGTFFPDEMPTILGCDGAGVVEAIGENVANFQVGDEVYFCQGGLGKKNTGNYAEFTVVDERFIAAKPKSLSFAEAAAAPLVLITAWESLYDRGRLQNGQKVLIHGGCGGVGHVSIQLAKLRGAEVYTTVGSPDKERLARQFGANFPILYKQIDFVQCILNSTDNEGVDLAFDTVGGETFFDTIKAVKLYGDLVTILQPNGDLKIARNRNLRISLELMLTPMLINSIPYQQYHADILTQCANWIDEGKLKIHLSQTFPLSEAYLAHQAIESGSTTGKIALICE